MLATLIQMLMSSSDAGIVVVNGAATDGKWSTSEAQWREIQKTSRAMPFIIFLSLFTCIALLVIAFYIVG